MLVAGAVQVTRCAAVVAAYGSSSEQSLQEQREADLAGAARVAGGGCGISFMWRLQEQLESLAVGVQICVRQSGQWLLEQRASEVARNEAGGCRISLVRRLLEQLESLAAGVACSSTGRSGQSLQEQRETEAAGAARVAGGGCATSYRLGLPEQLESLAPGGSSCGST